jgi:hypothetical protein
VDAGVGLFLVVLAIFLGIQLVRTRSQHGPQE